MTPQFEALSSTVLNAIQEETTRKVNWTSATGGILRQTGLLVKTEGQNGEDRL